jgi:hypothetical protein
VRCREPVDQVQNDRLSVRVGRTRNGRVEHGVAERLDLLCLMGVLYCPGGRHHGVGEAVIVDECIEVEPVYLLAQFLDSLGQLGEPLLPPLLQPPAEGGNEGDSQGVARASGTQPSAASATRAAISWPVLLPGGVVSMRVRLAVRRPGSPLTMPRPAGRQPGLIAVVGDQVAPKPNAATSTFSGSDNQSWPTAVGRGPGFIEDHELSRAERVAMVRFFKKTRHEGLKGRARLASGKANYRQPFVPPR